MIAIRSLAALLTYLICLCGVMPLFPWLMPFPRIILVSAFCFGLWQDFTSNWKLKPWMQNVSIAPLFIYYALQFSRSNPVAPVVSVLAVMLAVRIGGEKTVRHSLQIYALSMFCLASSSLFDLSPVFLIYLGFMLFLMAPGLVLLTFQSQETAMTVSVADLKKIVSYGLLLPTLTIPLLLLFFPIIPRTQLPLWNFLNPPVPNSTGYSDKVEPGSQSSITESRSLAFRAELPYQGDLKPYWRATVFNRTDGNRWSRIIQIPTEQTAFSGKAVRQVIYPEPSATCTLIALDRPETLNVLNVVRLPDGVFELMRTSRKRMTYNASSHVSGVVKLSNKVNRSFYLQLPDRLAPRISSLAHDIAKGANDDRTRVSLLEKYYRNGGYRYTTRDLATGDKAVEHFLFDKKQGHCEFFASSFALLLRAAGVPCRLVGGYLGGEYNHLGGYYLVTDDKAHVWVEAYIEGSGWERIDPSSFASNAGDVWMNSGSLGLKKRVALMLDSMDYLWSRSVITYDFEQQMNMAQNIGSRLQHIDTSKLLGRVVPFIVVALLLVCPGYMLRNSLLFRSREQRILHYFVKKLEREFNLIMGSGELGLFEVAAKVNNHHVSEFVSIYAGAIYRDRRLTDDEYLRLKEILRAISGTNGT